jgi:uncharacterized protein YxeA
LKKIIYILIIILILIWIGLVYALDDISADGFNEEITTSGVMFNIEQSIKGNGFANEYQYSLTGPTESKSKTHGAGYIKKDEHQSF